MRFVRTTSLFIACVLAGVAVKTLAEEPPYTHGSVVHMTFVRTKDGGFEQYMKFLDTTWKSLMEASKKDGLITAYRVVAAPASSKDDWDLCLITEFKNMAALDGLDAKERALIEKQVGSMEKAEKEAAKRTEIREIVGEKLGRELILK